MSTSYFISKVEAQQNTRRAVRDAIKRKARSDLFLTIATLLIAIAAGIIFIQSREQELIDEIVDQSHQLSVKEQQLNELSDENRALGAELSDTYSKLYETQNKLDVFVNDAEIVAAAPPVYNVPLSLELQQYTYNMCVEYGIADEYELVLAVMWQESNFVDNTISETDDYGLMQINSSNHAWLSELLGITDFLDAKQNIYAGVSMLAKLLNKYDTQEALMAYNMGEGGAQSFWDTGIYTSNYSRSVAEKREQLVIAGYNPN